MTYPAPLPHDFISANVPLPRTPQQPYPTVRAWYAWSELERQLTGPTVTPPESPTTNAAGVAAIRKRTPPRRSQGVGPRGSS
jgi:hypothetical protein